MRIAILGAGVIGTTTAYELARNPDHKITVFDVGEAAANEASAVNASMIAPGHAFAWASPKVPFILIKSLYRHDQAFRFKLRFDRDFWNWTMLFLKQCTARRAVRNTLRKHALCTYSQSRLAEVVDETNVEYNRTTRGLLYFSRTKKTLKSSIKNMRILEDDGQKVEILTPDQIAELDPAFTNAKSMNAGAIYCETDETGSSQMFTRAIAGVCESRGVDFRHGCKVESLHTTGDRVDGIKTSTGDFEADLVIVSLGAHTPLLLAPIGIQVPIYPVKGYSLSLPVRDTDSPPEIGAVDEDHLVALVRIGRIFRVTAAAEFAGYDARHKRKDYEYMWNTVTDLFPDGADYTRPIHRACFRPMTPQGTPYIGFTHYENLFVNSGHGHMGWTMACGAAKIAADIIEGREPEIESAHFALPEQS